MKKISLLLIISTVLSLDCLSQKTTDTIHVEYFYDEDSIPNSFRSELVVYAMGMAYYRSYRLQKNEHCSYLRPKILYRNGSGNKVLLSCSTGTITNKQGCHLFSVAISPDELQKYQGDLHGLYRFFYESYIKNGPP